jgi:hypothetical protein
MSTSQGKEVHFTIGIYWNLCYNEMAKGIKYFNPEEKILRQFQLIAARSHVNIFI